MNNKHIILIGFMGTGKSSVGKILSKSLELPYIDTDYKIELRKQQSIPKIFEKGEAYFRSIEEETLNDIIINHSPSIISTGGGIILSEKNRALMKNHLVILLQASIEEIYKRVKQNQERPLLHVKDVRGKIADTLDQRKALYAHLANITINTDNKEIKQVAEEIVSNLPQKV